MKQIRHYWLAYMPRGSGYATIVFKDNTQMELTLTATELAALASVLAQSNIGYNTQNGLFYSYDDDAPRNFEHLNT